MTQSQEPEDRTLDRTLRAFDRRISRLEDTQVTWRELNSAFNRIDDQFAQVNQRFDEVNQRLDSLDAKFDVIMKHITGEAK
jgi:predicted nuclease with TOPRIM domain